MPISANEILAWSEMGEGQHIAFMNDSANETLVGATLAAFANGAGGVLLFGLNGAREIVGVADATTITNLVYAAAHATMPRLDEVIEVSEVKVDAASSSVIAAIVPDALTDTYLAAGSYWMREGMVNVLMSAQAVAEHVRLRAAIPFDRQPIEGASFQSLSEERLTQFLRHRPAGSAAQSRPDLQSLPVRASLRNLGVIGEAGGGVHPTVAGLLMFGRRPQELLPQSILQCARFAGSGVSRFLDRTEVAAPIEEQVEEAVAFVGRNIRHGTYIERVHHVDVDEYPTAAIREALINALCHRDYYQSGTAVNLSIFSDRIEILNPGGLLPGLHPDQLEGQHRLRNQALGQLMYEAGLIERWGSGIRRMREAMEEAGLRTPQIDADRDWFRITFYGPGEAFLGLAASQSPAFSAQILGRLNLRQRRLLVQMQARGQITRLEYEQEYEVERSQAHRDLSEMVELGLLRREGSNRASYYVLIETTADQP